MAPPNRFVFIDYENDPTKDSKRIENRQKVAKYAMLGRSRTATSGQQTPSIKATATKPRSTKKSTATAPRDPHSDWDLVHQSHTPKPPASLTSFTSNVSTASNTSTSPPIDSVNSPPSWPDQSSYPSGSQDLPRPSYTRNDSKVGSRRSNVEQCSPPVSHDEHDFYASAGPDQGLWPVRAQAITSVRQTPVRPQEGDARLAEKRRQARKRHEQLKWSQARHDEADGTSFDKGELQLSPSHANHGSRHDSRPSPRSLLSGSEADPFASLPIKANNHTHELLYQYMNARLISSVLAQGSPETFERIKRMRHEVWGPLTMHSKASLSALVAYVESTPGLPIKSRSKDFLFSHVQAALKAVRKALSRPDVAADDGICLAVVLLMLTAQREGSVETYAQHAAGLATLLQYRTEAIHKKGNQPDTVSRLKSFFKSTPNDECLYCQTNGSPARAKSPEYEREAFATDMDSFNAAYYPRGEGLRELVRKGYLTENLKAFIEPAMIWSTLAERARRDKLSAAIGATHAWIDEGEFSLHSQAPPLDTAFFTTVRLCFYLSSWLDWQHSCSAVRRLSDAVFVTLDRAGDLLDRLAEEMPTAVMWLCLMSGPLCEGEKRTWFAELLTRTRLISPYWDTVTSFDALIGELSQSFVWSGTMTKGAEILWNETAPVDVTQTQPGMQDGFGYVPEQGYGHCPDHSIVQDFDGAESYQWYQQGPRVQEIW